jgi:hypothetical protein
MESPPLRILSLDGGGIMGAIAASALATVERTTGKRIIEHFDLLAGASASITIRRRESCGSAFHHDLRVFSGRQGPASGGRARPRRRWQQSRGQSATLRAEMAKVESESRQGSPGQSAFAPAALVRSPAHEFW